MNKFGKNMDRRQFLFFSNVLMLSNLPCLKVLAGVSQQGDDITTGFVFDEIYLEHWLEQGHPESPQRLQAIMRKMKSEGLLEEVNNIELMTNVLPYIYQIHTESHVSQIQSTYGHSNDVAVAVVAGALAATDAVCHGKFKNAFCATRPPGHHAVNTGKVEGFCFYNAVAIAARYAQNVCKKRKILIIDWDYHHGNGTEAAFYYDDSVLYFSTHDFYAYPGTGHPDRIGEGRGKGFNINVHLDCGATNKDIITAFENKLLPAADQFKPDMIFISAGFDSKKDDLLGCFDITDKGFIELTKMVMALADRYCDGRIVSILEGGYNIEGNASATVAHVNTLLGA